jgi:hypothetical protein
MKRRNHHSWRDRSEQSRRAADERVQPDEATLPAQRTWLHRHKHLVLVLILGCGFIMQSAAHGMRGQVFAKIFISLIFLAVLLVVFEHRRSRMVALLLAVVGIISSWARYVLPAEEFQVPLTVVHFALQTLFLGYAVAVILGDIFKKSTVGADEVLGAMSGYLIAGAAWSSLYSLADTLVPGSFALSPAFVAQPWDWDGRSALFNYFSMVTLTTMGYGDITPARGPATAFAIIEAVFGQFYIAVVVAQLVGARMTGGLRYMPAGSATSALLNEQSAGQGLLARSQP